MLRLLLISSFGLLFHGPLGHIFYTNLNSALPDSSLVGVGKKVVIDQLFYVPFLYSVFLAHVGVLLGFSPKTILLQIKKALPQLVLSSWALWPVSHLINFSLVPARFRLLFINFVQLISNVIVAMIMKKVM
jgi:protein Mpv17